MLLKSQTWPKERTAKLRSTASMLETALARVSAPTLVGKHSFRIRLEKKVTRKSKSDKEK